MAQPKNKTKQIHQITGSDLTKKEIFGIFGSNATKKLDLKHFEPKCSVSFLRKYVSGFCLILGLLVFFLNTFKKS